MEKIKKKRSKFKIIFNIISSTLLVLCLFVIIYGSISIKKNKEAKFFGYSFSYVPTESMKPVINPNDIIVIKDIDFDDIKVDDIIVYYNKDHNINIVHRVIDIDSNGNLITKGDNNTSIDSLVTNRDNYVGKVVKYGSFLGLGKLVNNKRNLIFAILTLIFIYILITELINIIKITKEKDLEEYKKKEEELKTIDKDKLRKEVLEEITKEKTNSN